MYQTIYEIPNKLETSTFFNPLFYVVAVCTALCALSWFGFSKEKKFWKWVTILFNVMTIALWIVHVVVVFEIKRQFVDDYYAGKYLVVEGDVTDIGVTEDGDKTFTVLYTNGEKTEKLKFIYPHSSGYGFKDDFEQGGTARYRISYIVDNSMNDNTDPKCIVKVEKTVENES